MRLILATYNPGKLEEISAMAAKVGIDAISLADVGASVQFSETGQTFEENAIAKLEQAQAALPGNTQDWIVADDSGLMIDALGGEPGVHTRRWNGTEMTDEQIEQMILDKLADTPPSERTAKLKCVAALGKAGQKPLIFSGEISGLILVAPDKDTAAVEGFPHAREFFIPELAMTYGQYMQSHPPEFLSHRGQAFKRVFSYINDLQSLTGQFE